MYKRAKIQDMGIPDLRKLPGNAGSSQFLNTFSFPLTRVLIMSILTLLLMQTFLAKGLVLYKSSLGHNQTVKQTPPLL
jgi:hypothetical protein